MDKKSNRRHHSEEFKLEAIELASRVGMSKAASELGVHLTSIRAWKKKFEDQTEDQKIGKSKKTYSELEKEIRRLHKENGYLKEINKVLKKSTAIFSADHMGNSK